MAPIEVSGTCAAPAKITVIRDIKCGKCNKNVRNGILCDYCDKWRHFKCGNVAENNIPADNVEWACPACIGTVNMAATSETTASEQQVKMDALIAKVLSLEECVQELKNENINLKKRCESSDIELCKSISADDRINARPRPNVTRPGWESVKGKTKAKSPKINQLNFPPLAITNRFQPLLSVDNFEETVPSVRQEPPKPRLVKQTSKNSKSIKIRCFSDSQGRRVANKLMLKSDHEVLNIMKPGAKFDQVTEECKSVCSDLGKEDVAVIIAGTNDVACNESSQLLRVMKKRLADLRHTNVVMFSIPHRHDLREWSCVNKEVKKTNELMKNICKHFSNVSFVDLSSLGSRFHTTNGLHLNNLGKMFIVQEILNKVNRINGNNSGSCKEPIPLGPLIENEAGFLGKN